MSDLQYVHDESERGEWDQFHAREVQNFVRQIGYLHLASIVVKLHRRFWLLQPKV
jgi:hypothetical protein